MPYKLSPAEAQLYKAVTDYVREEFNRAENLQNGKRAGTVGFALTILQRRLASSPKAIYQSLRRRRERLEKRLREAELMHRAATLVVVPVGLLAAIGGRNIPARPVDTQASAARARAIVMDVERNLGFEPVDHELDKLGYDIESHVTNGPDKGRLRFHRGEGRVSGADTITVTRNEILYSLNKRDDFILAIVEFMDGDAHRVHYVRLMFDGPSSENPTSARPA